MAKEEVTKKQPDDVFPLSLDEFCARLSQSDRRVELIGGFHHSERSAGRLKDTSADYQQRFVDFTTKPA